MGCQPSKRVECTRETCNIPILQISIHFESWIATHRPRREEVKHFPRIHSGQDAEEVLAKYFEKRPKEKVTAPKSKALDCFVISNDLLNLFEESKSEFQAVCKTLQEIVREPTSFKKFFLSHQNYRHAHVRDTRNIIVFEIPKDIPNLISVLYYGSPTALMHLRSESPSDRVERSLSKDYGFHRPFGGKVKVYPMAGPGFSSNKRKA